MIGGLLSLLPHCCPLGGHVIAWHAHADFQDPLGTYVVSCTKRHSSQSLGTGVSLHAVYIFDCTDHYLLHVGSGIVDSILLVTLLVAHLFLTQAESRLDIDPEDLACQLWFWACAL